MTLQSPIIDPAATIPVAAPRLEGGLSRLRELEAHSIYILREAYRHFDSLAMLWSIGKDSTVMLWLARKAFAGEVPIPLVHVDTSYKIPAMIEYRDRLAREWGLTMIVGGNQEALAEGMGPDKGRLNCCAALKTEALRRTLDGTGQRLRMNAAGEYVPDWNPRPYNGVIVGARADEEGSRSKERTFSPRNDQNDWDVSEQPPEFWNQFKTRFAPGTHVRVHPLLDWTEIDLWVYIAQEQIPIIDLYYDRGAGTRYRSLGCEPCTGFIQSTATDPEQVVAELRETNTPERAGRAQDAEDPHAMEKLRRDGYM